MPEIRSMVIGALIVATVSGLFINFTLGPGGIWNVYGVSGDTSGLEALNRTQEIMTMMNQSRTFLSQTTLFPGSDILIGAIQSGILMFSLLNLNLNIITDIGKMIPFAGEITLLAISIVTLIVIFEVLSAFLRRDM